MMCGVTRHIGLRDRDRRYRSATTRTAAWVTLKRANFLSMNGAFPLDCRLQRLPRARAVGMQFLTTKRHAINHHERQRNFFSQGDIEEPGRDPKESSDDQKEPA